MKRIVRFFYYKLDSPLSYLAIIVLALITLRFGTHMIIGQDLVIEFPIADGLSGELKHTIFGYTLIVFSLHLLISINLTLIYTAIKEIRRKPVVDTKLRNPYLCFNAEHFRKKTYRGK